MYAVPHNRSVNTNSKGLILDHMTWSATHFNVPMVTADFLTALLRAAWRCDIHTCLHTLRNTHTQTHTQVYLTLTKGDTHSFSLLQTSSVHTNKNTLTQPKKQRIIWCCVDPRSCENLRSVSPPPSHVLLLSALMPSLCRSTWLEGRNSGAPLQQAETLGCSKGSRDV